MNKIENQLRLLKKLADINAFQKNFFLYIQGYTFDKEEKLLEDISRKNSCFSIAGYQEMQPFT